jgi:hypothetical protein
MTLIVVELGRAQHRAVVLAEEGKSTAYYLGALGKQLARLRAHVAIGHQKTPEAFGQRAELLSQVETRLQGVGLRPGRSKSWSRRLRCRAPWAAPRTGTAACSSVPRPTGKVVGP